MEQLTYSYINVNKCVPSNKVWTRLTDTFTAADKGKISQLWKTGQPCPAENLKMPPQPWGENLFLKWSENSRDERLHCCFSVQSRSVLSSPPPRPPGQEQRQQTSDLTPDVFLFSNAPKIWLDLTTVAVKVTHCFK